MKKMGKGIALTVLSACLMFNAVFTDTFVASAAEDTAAIADTVDDKAPYEEALDMAGEEAAGQDASDSAAADVTDKESLDEDITDPSGKESSGDDEAGGEAGDSDDAASEVAGASDSSLEDPESPDAIDDALLDDEALTEKLSELTEGAESSEDAALLKEDTPEDIEKEDNLLGASNQVGADITYTFTGGVLTLKGTGATYNYDNKNASPFKSLTGIKSIVVSEGITALGSQIFEGCGDHNGNHGTSITKISLPSTLTTIGERAFYYTYATQADLVVPSGVTNIAKSGVGGYFRNLEFAQGTRKIPDYAASGAIITGVLKLPSSLESIGDHSFYAILVHNDVTFPASLKSIGSAAFGHHIGDRFYFTGDAPTIADDAFKLNFDTVVNYDHYLIGYYPKDNKTWSDSVLKSYRSRLTDIDFRPNGGAVSNKCGDNITWSISGETLTLKGSGPMYNYAGNNRAPWSDRLRDFKTISIDNNITTIGDFAFYGASSMNGTIAVRLPSKLTRIGKFSFYDIQPTGVNLPSGVTYIGDYAFYGNVYMTTNGFKLSSDTTYVGEGAFASCTDAAIEIPTFGRITHIGNSAFYNCDRLTGSLSFPETLTYLGDSAFSSCEILKAELKLPSKLTYLGKQAFSSTKGITGNIVIPSAITEIGNYTFMNNAITGVTIGDKVTLIGQNAFRECTSLKTVSLGNSISEISFNAFNGCTALTELELPASLTKLALSAITKSGVKKIIFKGDMPQMVYSLSSGETVQKNIQIHYPLSMPGWYSRTDDEKAQKLSLQAYSPVFVPYGDTQKLTVTFVNYSKPSEVLGTQEVAGGQTLTITRNFEKEGYVLDGYYVDKIGSSNKILFDFTKPVTKNTTIYVRYSTRYCRVYFDPANGKEKIYYEVKYGDKFSSYEHMRPDDWEGHYFVGWSSTPVTVGKGGNRVDVTVPIIVKEDVTFYAIWLNTEHIYVYFDTGVEGYTFQPEELYASYIAHIYYLETPDRRGYEFCGWYYDKEYTRKAEIDDYVSVPSVTLYAKWKQITRKVFFDASESDNVQSFTVEVPIYDYLKEPDVKPVKAGMTFIGWCSEGKYTPYPFGDGVIYEDMTLVARFFDPNEDFGDVSKTVREATGYMHVAEIPAGGWIYTPKTSYSYTGKPITPTNFSVFNHTKRLKEGRDYTCKFKNNVNPGKGRIIVTFTGGYSGTIEGSFNITPFSLYSAQYNKKLEIAYPDVYLSYNGKVQKAKNTLKLDLAGKTVTLKEGTDFEYSYPTTDTTRKIQGDDVLKVPGTYRVIIRGKNKFTGEVTFNEHITELTPMSKVKISGVKNLQYTGSALTQTGFVVKYGTGILEEGKDFTAEYRNNTQIGTAVMTLKAKDGSGFAGDKAVTFRITGTPLSKTVIAGIKASMPYENGKEISQFVKLYTSKAAAKAGDDTALLKEGTDYSLTYEGDRTATGTVTMIFTGMGRYEGVVKKTFKIVPAVLNPDNDIKLLVNTNHEYDYTHLSGSQTARVLVVVSPSYAYEKKGVKPAPKVYYRNEEGVYQTLRQSEDYTLSFGSNNRIGTLTGLVKVTLKGRFKGSVQYRFDITTGDFSTWKISASDVRYKKAKGNARPSVTVVDQNGTKLVKGKDYTVSVRYSDETPVDIAREQVPANTELKAIIHPLGNYKEEGDNLIRKSSYRVYTKDRDIASSRVTIKDVVYQGKAVTRDDVMITVVLNGTPLKLGINSNNCDYMITSITGNDKPGTVKVTLRGCGSYAGTKTVTFRILKNNLSK